MSSASQTGRKMLFLSGKENEPFSKKVREKEDAIVGRRFVLTSHEHRNEVAFARQAKSKDAKFSVYREEQVPRGLEGDSSGFSSTTVQTGGGSSAATRSTRLKTLPAKAVEKVPDKRVPIATNFPQEYVSSDLRLQLPRIARTTKQSSVPGPSSLTSTSTINSALEKTRKFRRANSVDITTESTATSLVGPLGPLGRRSHSEDRITNSKGRGVYNEPIVKYPYRASKEGCKRGYQSRGVKRNKMTIAANTVDGLINVSRKDHADALSSRSRNDLNPRVNIPQCIPGRVITPIDVPPPIAPIPIKMRQRQGDFKSRVKKPEYYGKESGKTEYFPAELVYHEEYHEDLPFVEIEKDVDAPQLSENFLQDPINPECRKLIVIFFLHVGTHCRYPSFIVYQAVKLFDVAIDRISIDPSHVQLFALAAMWIALKRHQTFMKIPSATKLASLLNEPCIGREILLANYERKILLALNFKITFADVFSLFTYHLINCRRQLDISHETTLFLYNCGGYLIDLTLLDERFCRVSACLLSITVAQLVLGFGLDCAENEENPSDIRPRWDFWRAIILGKHSSLFSGFQEDEIAGLRVTLLRHVRNSGKKGSVFEVVYKKYSRSRHGRISEALAKRSNRISFAELLDP